MAEVDRDVLRTVLLHFLSHPEAAETLEGITAWRLADDGLTLEQAKSAVNTLVARGLLQETVAGSGSRRFRLNHARRQDAERV